MACFSRLRRRFRFLVRLRLNSSSSNCRLRKFSSFVDSIGTFLCLLHPFVVSSILSPLIPFPTLGHFQLSCFLVLKKRAFAVSFILPFSTILSTLLSDISAIPLLLPSTFLLCLDSSASVWKATKIHFTHNPLRRFSRLRAQLAAFRVGIQYPHPTFQTD